MLEHLPIRKKQTPMIKTYSIHFIQQRYENKSFVITSSNYKKT